MSRDSVLLDTGRAEVLYRWLLRQTVRTQTQQEAFLAFAAHLDAVKPLPAGARRVDSVESTWETWEIRP